MNITKLILIAALCTVVACSPALSMGRAEKPRPTPRFLTARDAKEQSGIPLEEVAFAYGKIEWKYISNNKVNSVQFFTLAPNTQQFLADPVSALRQHRIAVPKAAEPHWRALTVALRRLANPHLPSASGSSKSPRNIANLKNEIARLQTPAGSIPIVGDWIGDGTTTVGASRVGPNDFLSDPVGSLRGRGVNVPREDEPAWRQLADALKALRRDYSKNWDDVTLKRGKTEEQGVNVTETQLKKSNDPFPKPTAKERTGKLKADTATTPSSDARAGVGFLRSMDSGKTWLIVGTCNTTRGCVALKDACSTLKNHTFKPQEGDDSVGECIDQTNVATRTFYLRNSNSSGAAGKNPATPTDPGEGGNNEVVRQPPGSSAGSASGGGKIKFNEFTIKKTSDLALPTIQCGGAVMCKKVKNICVTLRGTYTRINDLSGSCRHPVKK